MATLSLAALAGSLARHQTRRASLRPSWIRPALTGCALLTACTLLTGCAGAAPSTAPSPTTPPTTTTPTTTTTTTTTSAATGVRVQAVIDIGGREAYGLTVHGDAVWAVSYQAGTLVRIDPGTGTVTRTVHMDPNPATLLSTGDTLWVASYGAGPADSMLSRVDPATGTVAARVPPGEVCCDLTWGGGSVWAVDPRGSILQIDPVRGSVTRRLPVTIDRSVHTNAVYAGDSLWVSSDNTPLYRMRPGGGAPMTIDVGGGVPFLADQGLVWGAAPDHLWAVDAATGAVKRRIPVPNSMEVMALAIGFDAIWVGIRHPGYVGAVLRLDPDSGAVLNELRDVDIPARIAVGFGSVWVSDSGRSSVVRISPGA